MKKQHHAHDDTFSFLEFGSISRSGGIKSVYDFRSDQDAYDWFMHARYSNDLVTYLELTDLIKHESAGGLAKRLRDRVHHANDFRLNLAKLAAVNAVKNPHFFEFGQTLFGCIDGMEFCKALLDKVKLCHAGHELSKIRWTGYDTSEFFNRLARVMHQSYSVTTSSELDLLHLDGGVAFAKGVTLLYAIDSLHDFNAWSSGSELTLFDYSFALGDSEVTTIGTGKEVTYLSLDGFLNSYDPSKRPLYVRGNSGLNRKNRRLFLEGVWGSPEPCQTFIELEKRYWRALEGDIEALSDIDSVAQVTWVELSEFVPRLERV